MEKAQKYCPDCSKNFCEDCLAFIHRKLKDHLSNITDVKGTQAPICNTHTLEVVYFCSECEILLCVKCITENVHNSHKIFLISESHDKILEAQTKNFDELKKIKVKFEENLKIIQKEETELKILQEDLSKMKNDSFQIIEEITKHQKSLNLKQVNLDFFNIKFNFTKMDNLRNDYYKRYKSLDISPFNLVTKSCFLSEFCSRFITLSNQDTVASLTISSSNWEGVLCQKASNITWKYKKTGNVFIGMIEKSKFTKEKTDYNSGYFWHFVNTGLYGADFSSNRQYAYTSPLMNDVIKMELKDGNIEFFLNGKSLGIAFKSLKNLDLYPAILFNSHAEFEILS